MEYGLVRLVIGSSKFVQITGTEYDHIARCRNILRETLSIEQKFDLLIDNYLEFETDLLDLAAREMVRGVRKWAQFQDQRNQINRRLVNLLSACRLYIDHGKHHISNIQLATDLRATVDSVLSTEYDSSLGYRFMEALRNYVQHRGYPVHGVEYDASRTADGSGVVFNVSPYLDLAQLEEDGKFKASVLKELKARGDKIDIKPFAREYIAGLGKVHETIREQLQEVLGESDRHVRAVIETYRMAEPSDATIIGLAAVRRDQQIYSDPIPLFENLLDYRATFEAKNRGLKNLGKRFVSGEVVRRR